MESFADQPDAEALRRREYFERIINTPRDWDAIRASRAEIDAAPYEALWEDEPIEDESVAVAVAAVEDVGKLSVPLNYGHGRA